MQRSLQHGRVYVLGNISGGDCQLASHAVGGGKGQTITKVTGLGKEMVSNLFCSSKAVMQHRLKQIVRQQHWTVVDT